MNWDRVQGAANQVRGVLKQKWATLTEDDLLLLEGQKEAFLGRLQQRTGLAAEEAERELDAVLSNYDLAHPAIIYLGPGETV